MSNRFGELCSRQVITDASKSYDDDVDDDDRNDDVSISDDNDNDDSSSCKVLVFSDKEVRNFSRPVRIGRILLDFVRRDWM